MTPAIAKTACLIAVSAALACPSPALAGRADTQFWLYGDVVVPLADSTVATLEVSPRFRERGAQLLTRGTVDFKLSPGVTAGGGAAYVEYAGGHEFRAVQQFTLSAGALSAKSRIEERFFAGASRAQLRLREKVQVSEPVAKGTKLIGAAELLYIARPENAASAARVDSWRFTAAVQHALSKHIEATVGYLLILSPHRGASDGVSHVPQLTLTFRP